MERLNILKISALCKPDNGSIRSNNINGNIRNNSIVSQKRDSYI